jgi:predicted Fe-Mo cluster-binding NifX family protein
VHAAGTRLGLLATHQHVGAAISNDYGPNCYIVLEAAGIPMYLAGVCRTAREAVEQFKAGQLASIHAPTSAGPSEPSVTH